MSTPDSDLPTGGQGQHLPVGDRPGVGTRTASCGSFVDRTDALWWGWRPDPGQRGGRLAEHRHGGGGL